MLKRVLTLGLLLIFASSLASAQEDLNPVVDLILKEKYGEAQKTLEGYTKMDKAPKNIDEVYYWLGKIELLNDNYKEAEVFFQKGLEEKGKSLMNYAGLARVRLKENNLSGANEMLMKAEELDKGKEREYSFQRAEALLEGTPDMVGDAKVILYSLRDGNDEDPRPNIYLGEYYVKQGVRELAYEELEKAITKKPDYVPAYVYLAELKYDDGIESKKAEDFNKGLEYANKAIELDPAYASAYRIRAELYLLARRFDQARKDMEKYVSETQGDLNARVRYASFLYLSKEYQEAVDELNKIEQAGLNNNLMRRLKGLSLIELGKLDEAASSMDEYFKNIKEEFTIWQDYKAMGDIYRLKGDLEKSDEYYAKMVNKNGEKVALFEELADKYEAMADEKLKAAGELKEKAKAQNAVLMAAYNKRKEAFPVYNKAKEEGDVELANAQASILQEQKQVMEEAEAKAKEFLAQVPAAEAEAQPFYPLEAHYRKLDIDYNEADSYQRFYSYALSLYNSGPDYYEEAAKYFKKCSELSTKPVNPYNYRLQISRHYEDADTTSMDWLMAEPAQDFVDSREGKAAAEMSRGEKRFLVACYGILVSKAFNPQALPKPTANDLDCEAATPIAQKLIALDPNNATAKGILDFCNN